MTDWTLAPNIAHINRTVRATPWMQDLGTIGNTAHLAGAGDHTPWSTHVGKYGYPTQGQVHAQDIGASEYYLDLIETFIRRSWRRGELSGVKYFNALNRHWNIQTWASWEQAKNGTLQSVYSGDHHVHISMENGDIDADIIDRFITWLNNGQSFDTPTPPQVQEEEDEMPFQRVKLEPGFSAPAESGDAVVFPKNCTVVSIQEVTDQRWAKVTFSSDFGSLYLRVAVHNGQWWELHNVDVTPEGNRIFQGFDLPKGANKISVARLASKGGSEDTPADIFIEYGTR